MPAAAVDTAVGFVFNDRNGDGQRQAEEGAGRQQGQQQLASWRLSGALEELRLSLLARSGWGVEIQRFGRGNHRQHGVF